MASLYDAMRLMGDISPKHFKFIIISIDARRGHHNARIREYAAHRPITELMAPIQAAMTLADAALDKRRCRAAAASPANLASPVAALLQDDAAGFTPGYTRSAVLLA